MSKKSSKAVLHMGCIKLFDSDKTMVWVVQRDLWPKVVYYDNAMGMPKVVYCDPISNRLSSSKFAHKRFVKVYAICLEMPWCHRENGGTLGMVPLIINPMYTLYSGYLLGISPFKGLLGGLNS